MARVEAMASDIGAAIYLAVATYWLLVVSIDGHEGSNVDQPLTGGHCLPPFRLYGLSCREWVVVGASALTLRIVLVGLGAVVLFLAARWRRTLLAVMGAMAVMIITFPSLFATLAGALVVIYAVSAWSRIVRIRNAISRSDAPI